MRILSRETSFGLVTMELAIDIGGNASAVVFLHTKGERPNMRCHMSILVPTRRYSLSCQYGGPMSEIKVLRGLLSDR